MSRVSTKRGKKLPGQEFSWDNEPGTEPDTTPTPLFPRYTVPHAHLLKPREQIQVDYYRQLRERFHEGPDYSVLDAVSSTAKKDTAERANFDPFHGMPSYSGRYQKKQRKIPDLRGRSFILKFFPRQLWPTIQPNFKPAITKDGYASQIKRAGLKRGFEDDEDAEDNDEEDDVAKRQRAGDDEDEVEKKEAAEDGDRDIADEDEDQEEQIVDDDFEEDEDDMGGDYNAEQYFDAGDDEFADDGFADGGPGGGDVDTF